MSLTLMRIDTALAGLIGITGCLPILAHPTRVESAFQLSSITSFAMITDSAGESGKVTQTLLPSIDMEASLGIRDTSRDDGPGLRLSASAGLSGYGGSAFVEWPRDWFGDMDFGAGLAGHHGALTLWTPYLQFGRKEREDMSWFVRNGIAFATASDSARWAVLWVPTIGIARHRSYRDAALFLSAVIGGQRRVERACFFFECFSYSNSYVRTQVMLGASLSFTLMTPYRPERR